MEKTVDKGKGRMRKERGRTGKEWEKKTRME